MPPPILPVMRPSKEEVAFVSFAPPEGFVPPSDIEDGDAFEVVASVRMQDGRVILDSVNGVKVGADTEVEENEEEDLNDDDLEEEVEEPTLQDAMRADGY